jgi:DNA polymerase III psi subunit
LENFILNSDFFNTQIFVLSDPPKLETTGKERILILTSPLTSNTSKEEADLLQKIVEAIGLDFASEVLHVTVLPESTFSLFALLEKLSLQHVLLFGVDRSQLGLHFELPHYQVFELEGIRLLCSESLTALHANINSKKQLWQALKGGFLK